MKDERIKELLRDLAKLWVATTTVDASEFPPHIARDRDLINVYLDGRAFAAAAVRRILGKYKEVERK